MHQQQSYQSEIYYVRMRQVAAKDPAFNCIIFSFALRLSLEKFVCRALILIFMSFIAH